MTAASAHTFSHGAELIADVMLRQDDNTTASNTGVMLIDHPQSVYWRTVEIRLNFAGAFIERLNDEVDEANIDVDFMR